VKQYSLIRKGNIFITKASVRYRTDFGRLTLIVDTGSSRTLISRFELESMSCNIVSSSKIQRLVTASGIVDAPMFTIDSFFCFGKRIDNFEIVAYDLPRESFVDGLLGMDFMSSFDISISTKNGTVIVK